MYKRQRHRTDAATEARRVDGVGRQKFDSIQVDAALKVWLVEVNSSPAIAEALADEFAKDVVSVAVYAYLGEECAETAFVKVE